MAIITDCSQQTSRAYTVTGSDGERRTVVTASCHIRPGKSMTISLDVHEAAIIGDDRASVAQAFAAYLAEEISKAAALGIPVVLPPADEVSRDG